MRGDEIALAFATAVLVLSSCGSNGNDPQQVFCAPGERRCDGDTLLQCTASGDEWLELRHCDGGCLNGVCIQPDAHCPEDQDCTGLECGPDPVCGQSCGVCDEGWDCQNAVCICAPNCEGLDCGPDPICGEICGACDSDYFCVDGECVEGDCTPNCVDLECGPDPVCGQSCGVCDEGWDCQNGVCICAPNCEGLDCGPDPICGESCGTCGANASCEDGTCACDDGFEGDPNVGCVCTPTTNCQDAGLECGMLHDGCEDINCGDCTHGRVCEQRICVIPEQLIPPLNLGYWNPLLTPRSQTAAHGSDNIYAPEVHRISESLCYMWYGAQDSNGNDQIFLATSTDCHHFSHYPNDSNPVPVLENETSNHINDPSVVWVNDQFYMYYTDAHIAEDDRIHLATSSNGIDWTKHGLVLDVGPDGTWDSFKVGRPAVLHINGVFHLWYDGNDGNHRHVGLATSTNGTSFVKHPGNPLLLHAGAIDVKKVDNSFLLVHEAHSGVLAATSDDGISWMDAGFILGLSGDVWDSHGMVTPFIFAPSGNFEALFMGGASHSCWCKNRIGVAYPQHIQPPDHPSAGCESCLSSSHSTCTEACRAGNHGIEGYCGSPGSTDPSSCCVCVPPF